MTIDIPLFDRNQGVIAQETATRQKLFDEYVNRLFEARSDVATAVTEIKGTNAQIAMGSLTPWVRHPFQLNLFSPRPNMVRFCIVFDTSLVRPHELTGFVKGVTNLKIQAQPD